MMYKGNTFRRWQQNVHDGEIGVYLLYYNI